jgi:hypothetical protein
MTLDESNTYTDLGDFKKQLAETIAHAAEWRDFKAAAYPDDSRNEQSARCLRQLARRMALLPGNHEQLTRLCQLWSTPKRDLELHQTWSAIEQEALRTYGFHEPQGGDPEEFLSTYIAGLEAEIRSDLLPWRR